MNFSTIIDGEKLELNFSPLMDEIQIINQTTNQHVDCILSAIRRLRRKVTELADQDGSPSVQITNINYNLLQMY